MTSIGILSSVTARGLRARRWNVLAAAASGVELAMCILVYNFSHPLLEGAATARYP